MNQQSATVIIYTVSSRIFESINLYFMTRTDFFLKCQLTGHCSTEIPTCAIWLSERQNLCQAQFVILFYAHTECYYEGHKIGNGKF